MPRSLPPLTALRAFEAAARLSSFTRAARELHVTPAAVSHQIRGLEKFLGVTLFRRTTRRLELTEQGRVAAELFREGFDKLARGDVDVALCDIRMPDGTGIDLLKQSKAAGIGTGYFAGAAVGALRTSPFFGPLRVRALVWVR